MGCISSAGLQLSKTMDSLLSKMLVEYGHFLSQMITTLLDTDGVSDVCYSTVKEDLEESYF